MHIKDPAQAARLLLVVGTSLSAAALSSVSVAQAKSTAVPDAQVESNVLKALASDARLADQQISSSTVLGTVTLSGHVKDDATRVLAEDTISRTAGVTKVVDELTLSSSNAPHSGDDGASASSQDSNPLLQSDGTIASEAPANPGVDRASGYEPGSGQPDTSTQSPNVSNYPAYPPSSGSPNAQSPQSPSVAQAPPYGQPPSEQSGEQYPGEQGSQPSYTQGSQPPYNQAPSTQRPYGQPYPGQQGPNAQAPGGQPPYNQGPYNQPPYGRYPQPYGSYPGGYPAQAGGQQVAVAPGATLQLRLNDGLDSRHTAVGTLFTGVVVHDLVADGSIAVPRGATVQGVVVDATHGGAIKGRASLALQLSTLTLGGRSYPLISDVWDQAGPNKTVRTVDSALGLGAVGAIIGGVAGGGAGAAIGAGAGGAAGVGASAASGGSDLFLPPESIISFRLAQPLALITVSQAELNRLAYNAGPPAPAVARRRYPPPPYPYYGPRYVYGPRVYYRPYYPYAY